VLYNYQIPDCIESPLKGLYQKKRISDDQIRLLIKVIFSERLVKHIYNIKIISFLGDGLVVRSSNLIVDEGIVDFNSNKSAIILSIPSLKQSKIEVCLSGLVEIEPQSKYIDPAKAAESYRDIHHYFNSYSGVTSLAKNDVIFCLPEKYLIVEFEIKDYLMSEMNIQPDNVSIYPLKKFKVQVNKKCSSHKYFIFVSDDPDLQVLALDLPLY